MGSKLEDKIVQDEDRSYCVYIHTNKINDKKYVGQTCQKPEYRWSNGNGYMHKNKNGEYNQPLFARAINKYGFDGFTHEIIKNNLTKYEADKLEKELIEKYETMNPSKGYNSKEGGANGRPSEEVRRRIGKKVKDERIQKKLRKRCRKHTKEEKFLKRQEKI